MQEEFSKKLRKIEEAGKRVKVLRNQDISYIISSRKLVKIFWPLCRVFAPGEGEKGTEEYA